MSTALINATPIAITYRDGRTETITLGELSIRNLHLFIKHLGGNDTPSLVALCAGKPIEWIDTLTDASYDDLVTLAVKLNFQRAADRMKNDPVALARLGGFMLQLESVVSQISLPATTGTSGSNASPTPVLSASAAETGNVSSS